jgi:hypothetical protein
VNKFIEKIFNEVIPDNKGYTYVMTEKIYIPVYKVALSITKRSQTKLNLVEEMVLRLIECEVTEIDEICGVLGLSRDILNITIGDLYGKNLVYPTANKCTLMNEGRNILKDLKVSKKSKDTIKNVYINSLNQEIFWERNHNIVDNCYEDDCKVQHSFEAENIEFYRDRISSIKEIFNRENQSYIPDNNYIPDELFSIDSIEDIYICFFKIPVHIYASENGTDIDILAADRTLNCLIENMKGIIIDQIRRHKILKRVFTKFVVKEVTKPEGSFEDSSKLKMLVKKYVTDKSNQNINFELISQNVFTNRILIENELEKFYELCLENSKKVVFYVDNLDFWSKNSKFITLISLLPAGVSYEIYYNNVGNIKFSEKRIKASVPKFNSSQLKLYSHKEWFNIVFDDKLRVMCCPENHMVFDSTTWIIKTKYYLQVLPR